MSRASLRGCFRLLLALVLVGGCAWLWFFFGPGASSTLFCRRQQHAIPKFVSEFRRDTVFHNSHLKKNETFHRTVGEVPFWRCQNKHQIDPADCKKRGTCDLNLNDVPLRFEEKLSWDQLKQCPHATSFHPSRLSAGGKSQVVKFQIYHLSKCGGTTLKHILNKALTDKGKSLMVNEVENRWDYKNYPNGKKPENVFIIGMMRDPFEYYVSYWSMFSIQLKLRDCTRIAAFKQGRFDDFFDNTQTHNITKFREYLHWQLVEMCDECHHSMWGYFNDLIGRKGDCPVYDALLRQENYYPTVEAAFRKYEQLTPGVVDWAVFNQLVQDKFNSNPRISSQLNEEKLKKVKGKAGVKLCPTHCFYDSYTRALVELHDAALLDYYNYTFQALVLRHQNRAKEAAAGHHEAVDECEECLV